MNKKIFVISLISVVLVLLSAGVAIACTNVLVSRGASADGSVMITYSCDGAFMPHFRIVPAADHEEGAMEEIFGVKIRQVAHTYRVVGLMNEHQLAIGETTTTGRLELRNPDGKLHYYHLMLLALQRARTAREAIGVIVELADEYGYMSTGETFSIADPNEVWIMELIGRGPGEKGLNYVAMRVPDGYVSCHANMSRIGVFPLDDPENCFYNDDIIEFATEKGYYDPGSGEPFSFREAFHQVDPMVLRYCATRDWSILRRVAPSLDLSPDYHRGVPGAKPYPLWVKPDRKLTTADVMSLMRDHYEGTPYDMTRGVDAGPFGTPVRWRATTSNPDASNGFEIDGEVYAWERPISTQRAAYVMLAQCRSWLPDPVGGVIWYAFDDSYTTPFVPLYCAVTEAPVSYTIGSKREFSWDSAWWVYNFVSNFTYYRWSRVIGDVRAARDDIESNFLAFQPLVDKTAAELAKTDPELMRRYLNDYCIGHAELTVERWRKLAAYLIAKHNDGFVLDEKGRSTAAGYPEGWLRGVLELKPDAFRLPEWEEEK